MKCINDKILDINLTNQEIKSLPISKEYRKLYLGGKGLAIRFLSDYLNPGTNPLSPQNILIFMTGPLSGTGAPSSDKFEVVTKSPLTGIAVSSSCGGSFGFYLKRSGYDGIIVRGRAVSPVYISINNQEISIVDAQHLWGLTTETAQNKIAKNHQGAVVIGPAGENLVRYSCIRSGDRFAGRCGTGAVMGSKNLKGIITAGTQRIAVEDPSRFKKTVFTCRERIRESHVTGVALASLGTPCWVNLCNEFNILPTKNFSSGRFDKAEQLSGEFIKEHYFHENTGCHGCMVKCGKELKVNGTLYRSPEYAGIAALGSNLMIGDAKEVIALNDLCNQLGMDVISTGVVLSYCMEMQEKGLVDFSLPFGDAGRVSDMLYDIAHQKGAGQELSRGVRWLSEKYGGKEFALHIKGLEMTTHDPRGIFGDALGYTTANRGACHLSGNTFATDLLYGLMNPLSIKGKPEWVKFTQDAMDFVNSMILCSFITIPLFMEDPSLKKIPLSMRKFISQNFPKIATKFSNIDIFLNLLSGATGNEYTKKECLQMGERIFNLERMLNVREGIDHLADTLPYRMSNEILPGSSYKQIPLQRMLTSYYKIREWDVNGIPSLKKIHQLHIAN